MTHGPLIGQLAPTQASHWSLIGWISVNMRPTFAGSCHQAVLCLLTSSLTQEERYNDHNSVEIIKCPLLCQGPDQHQEGPGPGTQCVVTQ